MKTKINIQTFTARLWENAFEDLALELFAFQFELNPAYRRICEAQGITPGTLSDWQQIPAVPTAAFKELEMTCLPVEERTTVFHSSGTTEQRPSRHFHNEESLRIYERSLWESFAQYLLPDSAEFVAAQPRVIALTPPPTEAPNSSLVHMFESVRTKLTPDDPGFWGTVDEKGGWSLKVAETMAALRESAAKKRAVILLGPAFCFVHLLDYLRADSIRFQLPPGSRVMETGGYKGRSRTIPKAQLYTMIAECFGIPPNSIVSEYGMSELSSQAYDRVCGAPGERARAFHFPRWARAQIISPETGREVAEGETGLIRVFDLASVYSVMAIQTEDLGIRRGSGFELAGRAAFAESRGCSLMATR